MRSKPRKQNFPKISSEVRALISYWLDALKEGEQSRAAQFDVGASSVTVPPLDVERGRCSPRLFGELSERAASRRKGEQERESDRRDMNVLLCPVRLKKSDRDEPGPRFLDLLWVPALLSRDGALRPQPGALPWIPRGALEPLVSDDIVTIGSVAHAEKFFERNPGPAGESWGQFWRYCVQYFEYVTGSSPLDFSVVGYATTNGLAVQNQTSAGGNAFVRIFEDILTGRRHPGLIPAFASIAEPQRRSFSETTGTLHRSAQRHCGQFEGRFSLAPSQRRAVHRFFETPESDFLCVTGPPGTGKTTLIQSIVASLFVRAAQAGEAYPPIIVAAGATNQSVMNVIDSFAKARREGDPFSERWLPGVESFGSFCASERKSREVEGYHLELRDGSGLSSFMETARYIKEAEAYWLGRFAACFGKSLGLSSAIAALRKSIKSELSNMYAASLAAKDGTFTEWIQSLVGLRPKRPYAEVFAELAQFDTSNRHRAFLFAVHYWEARWLQEAGAELNRRRSANDDRQRFRGAVHDWRRRAMVTPAFVSTLAMTGRFFRGRPDESGPPIDLLIFDEAGQIPPELALPCAALAKKSLVVGDYLQLEPVWAVTEHVDRAAAAKHRLLKANDSARWDALARRGLTSSRSSFMQLALRSSKQLDGSTLGVFLTEHRRSVPEIVRFCNALAYNNRLEAKRPDLKQRILPVFGYLNVPGVSERRGTSRINRIEARHVLAWLEQNEAEILSFYSVPELADVVAVVSPFSAHIEELKRLIGHRYPGMVIGTVHSLQGAEMPIVVFSSVYDSVREDKSFIDRNTNLLNVAVSRAKDSFIVIGNIDTFDPIAETPSALLGRFLRSRPENALELREDPSAPEPVRGETVVELIRTLDGHRKALADALMTARREVVIVSAQVSSAAIKGDRLDAQIKNALARGVRVRLFTDATTDVKDGALTANAAEGRQMLVETGAEFRLTTKLHSKFICVDDHTYLTGSFNWLSASRAEHSDFSKYETTTCIRGPAAAEKIRILTEDMEYLAGLQEALEKRGKDAPSINT